MNIIAIASPAAHAVHKIGSSAATAADGHPALYETCATIIIAVVVVIYFEQHGTRELPLQIRTFTVMQLSTILSIGLAIPVLALADLMPDNFRIRLAVVIYTLLFLFAACSLVVRTWGREDGQRLRSAQPQPPREPLPLPAVPGPRPDITERERAADILGLTLAICGYVHPALSDARIKVGGKEAEIAMMRDMTSRWVAVQPSLLAVCASYPLAGFREHGLAFAQVASKAFTSMAVMLASPEDEAAGQRAEVLAAYETLDEAWRAAVDALHLEDEQELPTRRAAGDTRLTDTLASRSGPQGVHGRAASARRGRRTGSSSPAPDPVSTGDRADRSPTRSTKLDA